MAANDYSAFRSHLVEELVAEGKSPEEVDENEAKQLFDMMREHYSDGNTSKPYSEVEVDDDEGIAAEAYEMAEKWSEGKLESPPSFFQPHETHTNGATFDSAPPVPEMQRSTTSSNNAVAHNETIYADDYIEWANSQANKNVAEVVAESTSNELSNSPENVIEEQRAKSSTNQLGRSLPRKYMSPLDATEDPHIAELQQTLPGLPMNRIEKVADEFAKTLGYPSIIRLSLAVRENMPDAFSPQCLTRKNFINAKHVMVSRWS